MGGLSTGGGSLDAGSSATGRSGDNLSGSKSFSFSGPVINQTDWKQLAMLGAGALLLLKIAKVI